MGSPWCGRCRWRHRQPGADDAGDLEALQAPGCHRRGDVPTFAELLLLRLSDNFRRASLPWAAALAGSLGTATDAQPYEAFAASGVFVQAGVAEQAQMPVAGAVWDWRWRGRKPFAGGELSGYWELSLGRWSSQREPGGSQSAWVTQLGVTPVWRWHPRDQSAQWFLEGGIDANLLAPIYRSRDKRFSTTFNFGDHLAVGRYLDGQRRHEVLLRLQHFSNAGIKQPNPGEGFLQLRYLGRF